MRAREELLHIRLHTSGFQVVLNRKGNYVSRFFHGFGEDSLKAAMDFRDKLFTDLPTRRSNTIPPEVLSALGLSAPVRGIQRLPSRSVYRVRFRVNGKRNLRGFYFRRVSEVEAYAAAIAFLEEVRPGVRKLRQP